MKRYLSLDVGSKTIGVAVSDELGLTAQGVTTIDRKNFKTALEDLLKIMDRFETRSLIVGLPRNMNGTEGSRCQSVRDFVREIQSRLEDVEVEFWDERLSTVEAERSLLEADMSRRKRKKVIDKQAAVIILQGFLDNLKSRENRELY